MTDSYLTPLGVYGFDPLEPVILTALITGDPLLLIGPCGTGKTFLLNSLSEALELEHRHYNASLISFDDLVGFPYPEEDRSAIRYLDTPATVWGAQSVLVDEISRCRPEHQNRFFSLIHERRLQGLPLESLRYRWAAMNPVGVDQSPDDTYSGSEALDVALADRFGFVIEVADWAALSDDDRDRIADPRGDGLTSNDGGRLRADLESWTATYQQLLGSPPRSVVSYARRVTTLLGQSGFRLSPRRARQISRSLLGVMALREGRALEQDFLLTLTWSIPHRAWGQQVLDETILAAHRIAWKASDAGLADQWLTDFLSESSLEGRARRVLEAPDPDTASVAIARYLSSAPPEDRAALSFALYPAAMEGRLPIGREGVADLGRLADEVLTVQGTLSWQERHGDSVSRAITIPHRGHEHSPPFFRREAVSS